jgi:hypothetical protein
MMRRTAAALLSIALLGTPALVGSAHADPRTVTIGIKQANSVYTFTGQVGPSVRGLQVTLARLDGATKRVTGVASTVTDATGRYSISTRLPAGMAGFYALTAPTATHTPGRSRLYGLVVPGSPTTARPARESAGQRNARVKAAQYLQFSAFSRSGLIEQLEFEGFSTADATYGTDAMRANWAVQAAKKAKQYLEFSAFSREGLIRQLEFEGFTTAEAVYGVTQAGL